MNLRKVAGIAKSIHGIATSDNPGAAAGKVARGALSIAHPVIGALGGKAVEKGTEFLVNKGIEVAHDPQVQAAAREFGHKAGEVAQGIGKQAGSVAQGLGRRVGAFAKGQMGARTHEHQEPSHADSGW